MPQGSPRPAWPHLRPHRTLKSALRLRKYTCTGMMIYLHRKQNWEIPCGHVVYLSSVWLSSTTNAAISTDFWPPQIRPPQNPRPHSCSCPCVAWAHRHEDAAMAFGWKLEEGWKSISERRTATRDISCRWFRIVNKYHLGLELGQMIREAVYLWRKIYNSL